MVTKKILIGTLLIIVSAIGVKAFAHSRLSKEETVKHITEKMAKKLSLTDEQKAKVFQINLDRAKGHEDAYKQGRKKRSNPKCRSKMENRFKAIFKR